VAVGVVFMNSNHAATIAGAGGVVEDTPPQSQKFNKRCV